MIIMIIVIRIIIVIVIATYTVLGGFLIVFVA